MNKEERLRFNEYLSEHPEERVTVEDLIARSNVISHDRKARSEERLAKIRECRERQRRLWGEDGI